MAVSLSELDWARLRRDLLDFILCKVPIFRDKVRFGAVCKSWQTVMIDRVIKHDSRIPMLLIPDKHNDKESRSLYSITEQKIVDSKLPMPYSTRCCGSSFGWLCFVTSTMGISIFNPFTNEKIELPPLLPIVEYSRGSGYAYTVGRVTLTSDPSLSPEDCVVVTIYGEYNRLAFIKFGEDFWSYENLHEPHALFSNVLYYKGQVLVLDHRSGLGSLDVNRNVLKILAPKDESSDRQTYLVETSSGDLLLLRRFIDPVTSDWQQNMTGDFKVYKLVVDDESGQLIERVEVKGIGDDALFVGDNHSISVPASSFLGCQSNSIYFTDDYIKTIPYWPDGPIDMGIFNIGDGSITMHYKPIPAHYRNMPQPIWITVPILFS